jgi:type IV secretion system protein VirB5
MRSVIVKGYLGFLAVVAVVPAHAQWAVIDAPAIAQAIKEVAALEQQVATARSQLLQAQQSLQAMTGPRGMEQLLSGTVYNYLPTNYAQLTSVLAGGGGYGSLGGEVRSGIAANAVLSAQQLAALSPAEQQLIGSARQWAALRQALAHQALANSSSRFASLQNLITAIGGAADQKGILELQARISAEMGMLQNEQTKLQVLNQTTQAQQTALEQQTREQVLAAHGSFGTRFQPSP